MNNRKRQVIESSLQLFTEKGFQNTSIQDILERANISKGTFYNYFSSKNECFMAILEQSRYEASLRRHELLVGKDKQDIDVLIEQIIVIMKINEEQNLITLFEGVIKSTDKELKRTLANHRLFEIEWLMERFTDVFGEEVRPYTFECGIIFWGMVNHLSMTWRNVYETQIEAKRLVRIALRNIQALLPTLIKENDVLLGPDIVHLLSKKMQQKPIEKDELTEQLQGFINRLDNEPNIIGEQFASCLAEEFSLATPRTHVIEVLLKPFREAFSNTSHEAASIDLANMMWYYLNTMTKSGEADC
ncbi:TetR/AcrR family transcriptional regulator [Solibacillus sp. CAU 1738]|uniref:TetR/AcrR family transcriptional regulator n=1 Tax=Solibacillus sp. CAU 1738 TaxID=3140363 RepID=UPI003261A688